MNRFEAQQHVIETVKSALSGEYGDSIADDFVVVLTDGPSVREVLDEDGYETTIDRGGILHRFIASPGQVESLMEEYARTTGEDIDVTAIDQLPWIG